MSGAADAATKGVAQVQELGRAVDAAWRAQDYRDAAFHELATEQLSAAGLELTPDALVEWALEQTVLPPQFDLKASFGQPPLTLFSSDRFVIDALFWRNSTTAIHEHSFSGAFTVLSGSSLHSRFGFSERRRLSPDLYLGELQPQEQELLRPGVVRPIVAGPSMIHSVFHLDLPTVSLVVRTREQFEGRPQFSYHRSGLAYAPFFEPATRKRQLQLIGAVTSYGRADGVRPHLKRYLEQVDVSAQVQALLQVGNRLRKPDVCVEVMEELGLDPELREAVTRTLYSARRSRYIIGRRNTLDDPGQRFLLALLLNLTDRESILELVAREYPELEPAAQITEWLDEIADEVHDRRHSPREPRGLDTALGGGALWVLEQLLRGEAPENVLARAGEAPPEREVDEQLVRLTLRLLPKLWALEPLLNTSEKTA